MLCIKLEGENRVVMDTVSSYIAEKYDISEELAMSWLIAAIWYDVVIDEITNQIDYLLDKGIISR